MINFEQNDSSESYPKMLIFKYSEYFLSAVFGRETKPHCAKKIHTNCSYSRYKIHWSAEFFRKIVANFSYCTKQILSRKINRTATKSALIETALYFNYLIFTLVPKVETVMAAFFVTFPEELIIVLIIMKRLKSFLQKQSQNSNLYQSTVKDLLSVTKI